MTDKEYQELKARLLSDGLVIEERDADQVKQHVYFKEANDYLRKQAKGFRRAEVRDWGPLYDNARKLVMWAYNASRVTQMPDNKRDEANKMLIELCERAFEIKKGYL